MRPWLPLVWLLTTCFTVSTVLDWVEDYIVIRASRLYDRPHDFDRRRARGQRYYDHKAEKRPCV